MLSVMTSVILPAWQVTVNTDRFRSSLSDEGTTRGAQELCAEILRKSKEYMDCKNPKKIWAQVAIQLRYRMFTI